MLRPAAIETKSVFGVDSKKYLRQHRTPEGLKEFHSNIAVVLKVDDESTFESNYDEIIDTIFKQFRLTKEKIVYKASEIGRLLPNQPNKYRSILLAFSREIHKLEGVNVYYCYTRLNLRYLKGKMITIFGKYGFPTEEVDIKKFMNLITNYYNVIAAWKISKVKHLRNATFYIDGMDSIYPTQAWNSLCKFNDVQIIYHGDHTSPILATADILVRNIYNFLLEEMDFLHEKTLKKIITNRGQLDLPNVSYYYIGNPDLKAIKPTEKRIITLHELNRYIRHPIIFISKGELQGYRNAVDELPILNKIHDKAYSLNAGIRIYDPNLDRFIIGKDKNTDYFVPLNAEADRQLELLTRGYTNIQKLQL